MRIQAWHRTRSRLIVMAVCVLGHAALLTLVRWTGHAAAPDTSRPITWVAIPLATRPQPQPQTDKPARPAAVPRPITFRPAPLAAAAEPVVLPALQAGTPAEPDTAPGAASAQAPLDLRLHPLPTSPANPSAATTARDALARDTARASGEPLQGRVAYEARGQGKHRVHYHGKCYDSHDTRASQLDPFNQANRTLQQLKPC